MGALLRTVYTHAIAQVNHTNCHTDRWRTACLKGLITEASWCFKLLTTVRKHSGPSVSVHGAETIQSPSVSVHGAETPQRL